MNKLFNLFKKTFFFISIFTFSKQSFLGTFHFWLKTPQNYKSCSKTAKIIRLPYYLSHFIKKSNFWCWPFFSDFWHGIALKRLFTPISQSPMSKLFRFSESSGKSNGKKWSQILTLLLIKGLKSPQNFYFIFSANFSLLAGLFWYRCCYPHLSRNALSPVRGFFTNSALWAELV